MDDKKLEKLIVKGFEAQDKKLDAIEKRQNKRFDAIEAEVAGMRVDMVTQDDLNQRLQDQTDSILGEMREGVSEIRSELEEIKRGVKALDERTNEETADLYKRVSVLEKRLEKLEHAQA